MTVGHLDDPFRLGARQVVKVVAIGIAQAGTLIGFLLLVRAIVDALVASAQPPVSPVDRPSLQWMLAGLLVLAVTHGWLRAWEFSLAEKIGYDVVRRIRMTMYAHLQGMSPRQLQGRARGGLLLRFVGDLSMLRTWLSRGLLGGLVALIVVTGALGVLVVVDRPLALSMVSVLSAGAALSLLSGKVMRRSTRVMRRRRSLVMSNIDEQINAQEVVQVFGRTRGEYARLSRQNDALNEALFAVAELRGRMRGIATATSMTALVAVLAVGSIEIESGRASLGLVVAALTVTRQLSGPIRTLGLAHDYWHRARVSRQKIEDFLASSSNDLVGVGQPSLKVRRGLVEFRDVSVRGALSSVTLRAQPGQLVAVTGRSGAGKSTLLGLLARLVDPDSGAVVVDGQPLETTGRRSASWSIGMVGPDLPLMRGTVRRNLMYRDRVLPPEELQRVVDVTGLEQVLTELPEGLRTWVTEGGRNLSAGQRQRIALCRALVGNPSVLLLDEPTSNLDLAGKSAVRDVISRHAGTVLLVTHDPAELILADQVWVLDAGRVTEVMSGDEYRDLAWLADQEGRSWQPSTTA